MKKTKTNRNRCRYILPHHCTLENVKLRVVFDCSAHSGGESLNEKLLHEPTWTNAVVDMPVYFQQQPIAVVADIKNMFSSVQMEKADRDLDAIRFHMI